MQPINQHVKIFNTACQHIQSIFVNARRQHHGNALFRAARALSPGTTNLVAMRQLRKDRSAFSRDKADLFIKEEEICRDERDEHEAKFR